MSYCLHDSIAHLDRNTHGSQTVVQSVACQWMGLLLKSQEAVKPRHPAAPTAVRFFVVSSAKNVCLVKAVFAF